MSTTPTIRVLGVPEHFNIPWHMAIDRGLFAKHNVKVEWTDVPEGTGEMIKRLKNGDADVIVALTEGLVADIAMEITNHNKLLDDTTGPSDETKSFSPTVQLIGTYVKSPLCWAISAGKHGKYKTVEDIKGSTIAISRYFSGSHLMACVLVQERGWRMNDVSFEVCGNFASLRNAVNEDPQSTGGANDGNQEKKQGKSVFLWETYMTKPYHESGELLRIGEISSPWPCFMMATSETFLNKTSEDSNKKGETSGTSNKEALRRMVHALHEACVLFRQEDEKDKILNTITEKFHIKREWAEEWYKNVSIDATFGISEHAINKAIEILSAAGVIPPTSPPSRPSTPTLTASTPATSSPISSDVFSADTSSSSSSSSSTSSSSPSPPSPPSPIISLQPSYFLSPLAHLIKDIHSMKIYSKPELIVSVRSALSEAKLNQGQISYKSLLPYDQHHYHGVESVDECVKLLNITNKSNIIDLGSGLGGPSRYLAGEYKCHVSSIELQPNLHEMALELTQRCEPEVAALVKHYQGDFNIVAKRLPAHSFDAIVSWLAVLHFNKEERSNMFQSAKHLLTKNGAFYADDFVALRELTQKEKDILSNEVYCNYLPTFKEYVEQATTEGFELVMSVDLTESWKDYTAKRVEATKAQLPQLIHRAGTKVAKGLLSFYSTIAQLFQDGGVGGRRIILKPKQTN